MTSALLLALAACGSRGVEYELKLVPIVPANQSPFSGLTRLELVIEPEAGAPTVIEVDQLTGSPLIDGLGELNNVRIAVRGYTGDTLTAFGRYLERGGALAEEARWGRVRALDGLGRAAARDTAIEALLAAHPGTIYADEAASMRGR